MMKKYLLILVCFISSLSFSQQYKNYTTKDGLPSNHIYKIVQDNDGFIWILTNKGIVKFNGEKFKVFTTKEGLPSNDIWDIRITPDNKKWFFTNASKLGYINNDTVYSFFSDDKKKVLNPLIINQYKNIISFSENTNNYFLKNDKWTKFKHNYSEGLIPIINDDYNNYLTYIDKSVKTKVLDSSFKLLNILDKKIISKYGNKGQIDSIFYFLRKDSYGILNAKELTIEGFKLKEKSRYVRVTKANDKLQISGLHFNAFLDKEYQITDYFSVPKKFNSHYTFADRNGNYWIATFTNGIYFLQKNKKNIISNFNKNRIGRVKKIRENLLVNVLNKGIYKIDSLTLKEEPYFLSKDYIYNFDTIVGFNKRFVSSDKSAIVFENNKENKIVKYGKSKIENLRKLIFHEGYLYGINSSKLHKIDPKTYSVIKIYFQYGIRKIFKYKNKIYLGTASGFKYFDDGKILDDPNIDFDRPVISILKLPNEKLIVGTEGFGAYVISNKKVSLIKGTEFLSVQDCFIKNNILWLATNKGVLNFERHFENWKFKNIYTTANGLPSNLIHQIYVTNSNLITASDVGLTSLPIGSDKNPNSLKIYVDNFTYNNSSSTTINKYKRPSQVNLSISQINFFENNKENNFQYQLIPIQNEWYNSNSSELLFNDLEPNKYTLLLKKGNIYANYKFEIQPLWYQNLFVKIGFSVLLFIFLVFILRQIEDYEFNRKAKKIFAQKQVMENELYALRSQMNPHFVFNSLNAIQYYITKNDIELSEKYLVKFSRLIRMFFEFSKEKEITLEEEIKLIKNYLEIEKMRFGDDFKFEIKKDSLINYVKQKIPTMLLQPIVENAVNHGLFHKNGKGLIEVEFKYITRKEYKIIVKDDGIGLLKSKEIQQKSLKNKNRKQRSTKIIQNRILLLNATRDYLISYSIKENNGTTITMNIKKNG